MSYAQAFGGWGEDGPWGGFGRERGERGWRRDERRGRDRGDGPRGGCDDGGARGGRGRWMNEERGERPGPGGPFGENGPFGPAGPFGPGGPFGPHGIFGDGGPFGPGGPFGGGRGRGRGRQGGGRGRARRGDVRNAALLLIAEQPMNGYQIIQALEERTGGMWRPSPGAIYPALAQLEDEGLIEASEVEGRKAFRITDAGRAEAEAAAEQPKPWDLPEQTPQAGHDAVKEMWGTFKQVAMAASAVTQTGDESAARAATDILGEARRDLYRLLADGHDADPDDTDGRDDEGPQDTVRGH